MKKDLKVGVFRANGEVKKVEGHYTVVITIPFACKESAAGCLEDLCTEGEFIFSEVQEPEKQKEGS